MKRTNVPLAELMGKGKVPKVGKVVEPTSDEKLQADLEAIDGTQSELTQIEEEQAKEILLVQAKYNQKKQPIYQKRREMIAKVPDFWMKTVLAYEPLENEIADQDHDVLSYLTDYKVAEQLDGTEQDYRVTFIFKENPYFENKELWKEYRFGEDEAQVTSSEIQWKDTPESKSIQDTLVLTLLAQKPVPDDVQPTFFSIFHPQDRDFNIGDQLRGAIWQNPLEVFMSADFSEVEDNEEGGDQGGQQGS